MARKPAASTVLSCLDRHPQAAAVLAHAELVLRAGRIYQSIAPGALAQVSRVANVKSGTVVIHADHGAAASKLKQQTQHLAGGFKKSGLECTGIEVRVQPSSYQDISMAGSEKPISEQALADIASAAECMPSASPLKAALLRLIARAPRKDGQSGQ
jgi:hypothetical protein